MLKKSHRLHKSEVERLYKKGKVTPQDFILARTLTNRAGHARFAVVVPKKVLPKATDRNRLKRLIYTWLAQQTALQGRNCDYALTIKQAVDEEPTKKTLEKLFERLP